MSVTEPSDAVNAGMAEEPEGGPCSCLVGLSLPSGSEVKETWLYTSTSPMMSCKIIQRDVTLCEAGCDHGFGLVDW